MRQLPRRRWLSQSCLSLLLVLTESSILFLSLNKKLVLHSQKIVLVLTLRMKHFFVVISKKPQTANLKPISKHKRAKEGIIDVFFSPSTYLIVFWNMIHNIHSSDCKELDQHPAPMHLHMEWENETWTFSLQVAGKKNRSQGWKLAIIMAFALWKI